MQKIIMYISLLKLVFEKQSNNIFSLEVFLKITFLLSVFLYVNIDQRMHLEGIKVKMYSSHVRIILRLCDLEFYDGKGKRYQKGNTKICILSTMTF